MTQPMTSVHAPENGLKKTPLHQLHHKHGAKMVAFAGYDMPVQYQDGVFKEHLHTRKNAGLFDVSHMGQAVISSATTDPATLLERFIPSDLKNLENGQMRYTVLLNEKGGIVDDLIVTRLDSKSFFIVVNASRKEVDYQHLEKMIGNDAQLTKLEDRGLIAVQGPKAESIIATYAPDVIAMTFMTMLKTSFMNVDCYISRSGYTGEDGFEISVPSADVVRITEKLLQHAELKLIGLGARDSLRLEAGLCLYGHDLDENTTPISANLKWVIPKLRREKADFSGAEFILQDLKQNPKRLRVGLVATDKAPIREGASLHTADGTQIGVVTSGTFSPMLDKPIMMGYVDFQFSQNNPELFALVRGQMRKVVITSLPFIQPHYKKGS